MRQIRSQSTSTSSSRAKRSLASFASASMAASFSPSRWRWSRSTVAVSTTEVTIPGFVTQLPIVQTAPSPVRAAIPRISSASLAAAASASRRLSIGVEPAWAAWPRKVIWCRSTPNVPSTTPSGSSMASSTGPCSMWSSRYAAALASCACASRARSMSTPWAASASSQRTPSASVRSRSSAWSAIVPDAALEPKSDRPKRAPSSSAQLTSRTVNGGVPSAAMRRSTSTPATTLSEPSSQPPFGTESMWPPSTSAVSDSPRSVNHWLPASSTSSTAPVGASFCESQSLAVTQVSVQATRWAPSSSPVSAPELAKLLDGAAWFQRHGGNV